MSFTQKILKAPALKPGETIGVIAPSSPQRDDQRLRNGINFLRQLGFEVKEGENLWNRYGYLAGTDEERIEDLNQMIRDPQVRMIVAGRGGYGATRILDQIDYESLQHDPKIILGFSDVTAINLALLGSINLVSFSGAMPGVDFWEEEPDRFTVESFMQGVTTSNNVGLVPQPEEALPIEGHFPGTATGRLIPANLTLLASLCGTPYLPDMRGAILLIEEIGEEAYRVDRLLSQLYNAGIFNQIGGLALGAFTGTEPKRISIDPLPINEVFREYIRRAAVPAISGVQYGHINRKLTLPVGTLARIDGTAGVLELLESGVE
ncbi:MAG: LD-carboxypeptidase [Ignavibacteriae bacterium]|nr:LD-carboxypeptidase [Ignavibacteriota bacterium]MCB9217330.1 LD-carboxypeptidase [Ignavibacteria bacterium]